MSPVRKELHEGYEFVRRQLVLMARVRGANRVIHTPSRQRVRGIRLAFQQEVEIRLTSQPLETRDTERRRSRPARPEHGGRLPRLGRAAAQRLRVPP
jgi:hypothetical protein